MRVDALDALLHRGGRVQRGVQREVGALRMAAHEQTLRQVRGDGFKVSCGLLLRGDGRGVGHVEVLAPAGDGRVSAAESHVGELLFVHERHGGELRLPLDVEQAEVVADDHATESRTGCEGEHVLFHATGNEAREHVLVPLGSQRVGEAGGASRRGQQVLHDGSERPERLPLAQRRHDALGANHAEL